MDACTHVAIAALLVLLGGADAEPGRELARATLKPQGSTRWR